MMHGNLGVEMTGNQGEIGRGESMAANIGLRVKNHRYRIGDYLMLLLLNVTSVEGERCIVQRG